ncbi:MAG TPA: sigma-70 family RNA polymerase sigma factor [Bryobacteraceae bacterium]|nr:sigma-70 family RNA polymerase sigma factor [Bryobacteraceae bacterium]
MDNTPGEITLLLKRVACGDSRAEDALAQAVYSELRRIAGRMMAREAPTHTLQPTAIADEAFLKLIDQPDRSWQNRAHFFAVAAQSMRRILVDYGRQKRALKRGRDLQRPADDLDCIGAFSSLDNVLAIDEALTRLSAIDSRQGRIVELRYFAGLTEDETAQVLAISPRTVKRDWAVARAWLYAELSRRPDQRPK